MLLNNVVLGRKIVKDVILQGNLQISGQEFTICKNVKLNKLNFVIYSTQHPLKGLPRVMFKSLF